MRVLICGDRNWDNTERVYTFLDKLIENNNIELIIHGGCRGADIIGGKWAKNRGIYVKQINAEWNKYGKAAGPIRNKKMLDEKPDIIIAFHNDIQNSKGTKNMVTQAREHAIKVIVVTDQCHYIL